MHTAYEPDLCDNAIRPGLTRPIRISFVIDDLSLAGTESQLLALVKGLSVSRFITQLVLLNGEGNESRQLEPGNCEIIRLGVRKLFSRKSYFAARHLEQVWTRNKPDIVQCYFLDSSYFAIPIAKWCGVPKVIRVRNNLGYWLSTRNRLLNRLIKPLTDLYLTNSEAGRAAIMQHEKIGDERIRMIENGVDLSRYPKTNRPQQRSNGLFKIGTVANLRPVKNIDGLIRVAATISQQHQNVVFEIAGEGEQRTELEELIRKHQLGDKCRLLGRVRDIPAFLQTLDLAILPSHSESLSNALLEYMAAGLAIIATDVGANRHLIHDGISGCIVPPNNDSALVSAISSLIAQPEKRKQFELMARLRVEEDFSQERAHRDLVEMYRGLAST